MKKIFLLVFLISFLFNCEIKKEEIPFLGIFKNDLDIKVIEKSDYFYVLLIDQNNQICYVNKNKDKDFFSIECYKNSEDVY